ncbi:hypothetical protein E3J61_03700 [Candidatus Dependentiae bacterium]|nr:MAG: hypothetical protein E3J61_03700 [Candidatus Dependentiae bacterium]
MKTTKNYRDMILLATLLFMVKAAWNLPSRRSLEQPILTAKSTAINKASTEQTDLSAAVPGIAFGDAWVAQRAKEEDKSFSVHEVDQDVLALIKDLQTQIDQAIELVQPSTTQAAQLASMKQRLVQFKREYKHTSPAVALLGPIGYTGIVVKEHRIEKGILKITNTLNSILHSHAQHEEEFVPVKAIAEGVETGHAILAQLNNPEINDQEPETAN